MLFWCWIAWALIQNFDAKFQKCDVKLPGSFFCMTYPVQGNYDTYNYLQKCCKQNWHFSNSIDKDYLINRSNFKKFAWAESHV